MTPGTKPAGCNHSISTNPPGQIKLIVAPTTTPKSGSALLNGTNLMFSGPNGVPPGNYYLIGATNLAPPPANWTRVATNQFDANGGFVFTNGIGAGAAQKFHRRQQ